MSTSLGTMNLVWSNLVSGTTIGALPASKSISFNDVGSNVFNLVDSTSGNLTGTLSHDLEINSLGSPVIVSSSFSGLSFTNGARLVFGNTGNGYQQFSSISTLAPTVEIDVGDGSSSVNNGNLNINAGTTIPNPFKIRPSTSSAGITYLAPYPVAAGTVYSGPMVLNSDSNCVSGSTFQFGGGTGATSLISGVISNGSSGAANITFSNYANSSVILSAINTFTSPTDWVGGSLEVNGSIGSSSSVLMKSSSTLMGAGTVGPLTITAGGTISTYSSVTPTTTQILTVNGNLHEAGAITHNFLVGTVNDSSKLQVNGNVTLSGTVAFGTGVWNVGTFTLLNYTGTSSGIWTTTIPGASIVNDTGNKRVMLTVVNPGYVSWVGANSTWSTPTNWNPNVAPNSTTVIADINQVYGSSGTITLDTNATVNQLNFNSASTTWLLGQSANVLTYQQRHPPLGAH